MKFVLAVCCHLALAGILLGQEGPSWQGKTPGQWADRLADQDVRTRWYAAYALGQIGPKATEALEPLRAILENRAENEYVRGTAAWAVGRLHVDHQPVVRLLTETLESGHVSVRRNSARALGNLGEAAKPAIPGLVALLQDGDATVRVNAAAALWQIDRHPRAIPSLMEMTHLKESPAPYQAVVALGRIGSQGGAVVPALLTALRHVDPDVGRAAATALAEIGPPAIAALKPALSDPDHEVRRRAVEAVGRIGPEAMPFLADALKNESPPVRRAAARALGRLGPQAGAAEPALLEAVNDADRQVREAAAHALSEIRKH